MSGAVFAPIWQLPGRIVAEVLGLPFAQYRPSSSASPIVPGNLVATIPVWISEDPLGMAVKPFDSKDPRGYGWFDRAFTKAGDYLVGSTVLGDPIWTLFIASQDVPASIQVVRCNAVISLQRPTDTDGMPNYAELATWWPAAIIEGGGRATKSPLDLPGDSTLSSFTILLPPSLGGMVDQDGTPTQLRVADEIVDAELIPNTYTVTGVEHSAYGWKVIANYAGP